MADLREQLLAVRSTYGSLTPVNVVEAARPVDAPLHPRFEWDDAVAGEAYRVVQARELIRSVRVRYSTDEGGTDSLRGFVSVSTADTPAREYKPVEEVADDPVLSALALRDAEREWRELFNRYRHLEAFVAIVQRDLGEAAA